MNSNRHPRVFISYSHDSPEHVVRVLELSEQLRADGFDTILDQYINGAPEQGWSTWTLDSIEQADRVVVVCTATYYRRFRGREEPGAGHGARWEGALILEELYSQRRPTSKYVPVLVTGGSAQHIPEPLRSRTHYRADDPQGYANLVRALAATAGVEPGTLGPPPSTDRTTAEQAIVTAGVPTVQVAHQRPVAASSHQRWKQAGPFVAAACMLALAIAAWSFGLFGGTPDDTPASDSVVLETATTEPELASDGDAAQTSNPQASPTAQAAATQALVVNTPTPAASATAAAQSEQSAAPTATASAAPAAPAPTAQVRQVPTAAPSQPTTPPVLEPTTAPAPTAAPLATPTAVPLPTATPMPPPTAVPTPTELPRPTGCAHTSSNSASLSNVPALSGAGPISFVTQPVEDSYGIIRVNTSFTSTEADHARSGFQVEYRTSAGGAWIPTGKYEPGDPPQCVVNPNLTMHNFALPDGGSLAVWAVSTTGQVQIRFRVVASNAAGQSVGIYEWAETPLTAIAN